MLNIKNILKKSNILYLINSKIKSFELKRGLSILSEDYRKKANNLGITYDANNAIKEFKNRLNNHQSNCFPKDADKLKVLWVGASRDQDESGFLQALKRLCTVTIYHNNNGKYGILPNSENGSKPPAFREVRKANDQALLRQVIVCKEKNGIDLILGQMWANLISKEALSSIRAMGIPVINISMDDRLPSNWDIRKGIRLGSVGLASSLDLVLTTSAETCLWYKVEGCPALYWPLASDPGVFSSEVDTVRDINVLFIGNKYGIRSHLIEYLQRHGITVECYGGGWSNGYVNSHQMAELSKRARIILGVGCVGHCNDVYTLKLRDFDAPMSGAMYLTHRNPDLLKIYTEGEEIECYETPEEALIKIQFYLANPNNLEKIAKNGFKKALEDHTWDQRLLKTFEQIGLVYKNTKSNVTATENA